jgi:hypothetical protein
MNHSGWAEWRRFSAALLALVGVFSVVEGLVAVYDGEAMGVEWSRVLFLDTATWGRVSVGLGALLLILGGWLWMVTVRVPLAVAVPAVMLHGLGQVGGLAAYPIWALLMIAFDVLIIFALTVSPASTARVGELAVSGSRGGYRPRHLWVPAAATVVFYPCVDAASADGTPGFVPGDGPAALPPIASAPVPTGFAAPVVPAETVRGIASVPWAGTAASVAAVSALEATASVATASGATAPVDGAGALTGTVSGPLTGTVSGPGARPYVDTMAQPWARSMNGSAERSPAGVLNRALPGATAQRPARPADGAPPILGAISGRCPDVPLQV